MHQELKGINDAGRGRRKARKHAVDDELRQGTDERILRLTKQKHKDGRPGQSQENEGDLAPIAASWLSRSRAACGVTQVGLREACLEL